MVKCRQCGNDKQEKDFYPRRRKCKECEAINHRYKYIRKNPEKHAEEIETIEELYRLQAERGLTPPPTSGRERSGSTAAEQQLQQEKWLRKQHGADTPQELTKWLIKDLTETPEYLLDVVYEDLQEKYAPQTGIDPDTMLPIRDEKYKKILELILARFNKYEDKYYD